MGAGGFLPTRYTTRSSPTAPEGSDVGDVMQLVCGNCEGVLVQREAHPRCPRCRTSWASLEVLALVRAHRRSPPLAPVSLVYEPNGTDHSDLILRVGAWVHRSASYYYALDRSRGQPPDTVDAICALLAGWKERLGGCAEGQTVFLPHGFSDQGSRWLRCRREGDTFEIVDGCSRVEGWSFYPSDFEDAARRIGDYVPADGFGDPFVVDRESLLAGLDASLALASARTPPGGRVGG